MKPKLSLNLQRFDKSKVNLISQIYQLQTEYYSKQNQSMLKKYENFYKLSKMKECSFYEANLREDMNKVLIKRIKSTWSWNQMLKSNALKIQSTQSFFPKVLEIFRHNGSYFIAYKKPCGPCLWFSDSSIKLEIVDFYQVCNAIIMSIEELKKQVSNMYIYPQWICLHRNGVKICHFQPYFQAQEMKKKQQDHVFMFDLMKGSYHKEEDDSTKKGKRIKNLNFNLGYIAYHLMTGQMTEWREDEEDYYIIVKQIQRSAQQKIIRQTDDSRLASLVAKLLSYTSDPNEFQSNQDQDQTFNQFKTYVNRKNLDCRAYTKRQSFRIVEFSLEKMKLQKKMSKIREEKKKKCVRPCCPKNFEAELNPENQYDDKFKVVENYTKNDQAMMSRKNRIATQDTQSHSQKKLFELSSSNRKILNRHKINSSCVLPELSLERKDSLLQEKMRSHRNRSSMFRNSMHGVGTIRSHLKTEY